MFDQGAFRLSLKAGFSLPTPGNTAMNKHAHQEISGFTLVELVTIIVILGILAALAAPRFFGRTDFDNRGFYDQVISTLRYAQKSAIAQRRFVCVTFGTSSVTLTQGATNSCGGALAMPSGETSLTSTKATFSASPDFNFDCLGRPRTVGGGALCEDAAGIKTAPTTISITNYATAIIVERETGYVH